MSEPLFAVAELHRGRCAHAERYCATTGETWTEPTLPLRKDDEMSEATITVTVKVRNLKGAKAVLTRICDAGLDGTGPDITDLDALESLLSLVSAMLEAAEAAS